MANLWQRVLYLIGIPVLLALITGCASGSESAPPTVAASEPTTAPVATEVVEPTAPPPTETTAPDPTETSESAEPTAEPEPTTASTDEVDLEGGIALYQSNGCIGCHTLTVANAVGTVGPSHNGVGTTATERIADPAYTGSATTAEEYIRESIINPTAFTVPGYPEGVMPSFASLDEATIDALVAMLLAQK